jgi:hypothetical protein
MKHGNKLRKFMVFLQETARIAKVFSEWYCDMMLKTQNFGVREASLHVATQQLVKSHFHCNEYAHNSGGTVGAVFSHWSATKLYKESQ